MAIITAQGISPLALELLVRSLVLPRTVTAVPGRDFSGPNGATISVRVRQPRDARVQASPGATITADAIVETAVDVTLSHLYDAANLTDEDLTLGIADFGAQVTQPQVGSIALAAENTVADAMNALTPDSIFDAADVEDAVLSARETLGDNDVPLGGRWLAVSPAVATALLKLDKFSRVDASGSSSALRDAVLGSIYGFSVVESAALNPGTCLAYHRSAFCFANRAPAIPNGAPNAAVRVEQGIALRVLFVFSTTTLADVSVVSTFAGCSQIVEDGEGGNDVKRVVKLDMTGVS